MPIFARNNGSIQFLMKRLLSIILIAAMAFALQNVAAKAPRTTRGTIPFDKLVTLIAKQNHWQEKNLTKMGLKKLVKKSEQEEFGESVIFVYGKNAKASISHNWSVTLTSMGAHAYAIEVALTTDNGTSLYFKEKADHDAFMSCAKRSKYYSRDGDCQAIGGSTIENDEYVNGWYVISFHGG